ncbi:hypothetical protein [Dactylosporangium sp. NPDC051541]|uniref:hypothetical protein n=1 Tax=Dactylosporangium sp. NPDC051541 TaxID=3363977 RepID=UPI0037B3F2ED
MRPLHPSAVPPEMIERATERRESGDWRGACAAAYVSPIVDLKDLRRVHGTTFAETVELDLRHLIPDLLRWYLPRNPVTGLLHPHMWYPLSRINEHYALHAYTPPLHEPQRIQVRVEQLGAPRPNRDDTLLLLPDRWDSRCTANLLTRCGGPNFLTSEPLLLDETGRHTDAWQAAGYNLQVELFDTRRPQDQIDPAAFTDPTRRRRAVEQSLSWLRPAFAYLPEAAAQYGGLVRIDVRGRRLILDTNQRTVRLLPRPRTTAKTTSPNSRSCP